MNKKMSKNNKLGVKGVYWHARDKKYIARIGKDGMKIDIGRYETIDEAREAYEQKAHELFGEYKYQEPPLTPSEISPKSDIYPAVRTSNVATEAVGGMQNG